VRPAQIALATQVQDELSLQRSSRLNEQRPVDRLVRHPHSLIGRKLGLQPAGDLLWRPVSRELGRDQLAQRAIPRELADLWPSGVLPRLLISLSRPIAAPAAVTVNLPRHRRRGPAQANSDPAS
jgi:hypothetical protein